LNRYVAILFIIGLAFFSYFQFVKDSGSKEVLNEQINEKQHDEGLNDPKKDTKYIKSAKSYGPTIQQKYITAKNEGDIKEDFIVLYSYEFKPGAEVKIINQKKGEIASIELQDATGLDLIKKGNKKYHLFSSKNKIYYSLDRNLSEISKFDENNSITFYEYQGNENIKVVRDIDMKYNWIKVSDSKEKEIFFVKVNGYVTSVKSDKEHYFVSVDLTDENRSVLYVINSAGQVEKEIKLAKKYGDDIEVFNNHLVITTKEEITVINKEDWNITFIKNTFFESNSDPVNVYKYDNMLYVTFNNRYTGMKVAVFDEDFNLSFKQDLKFPYTEVLFNKDKMYVASYSLHKDYRGIIGEFRLPSLTKTGQILIPNSNIDGAAFYGFDLLERD
jgi:hypothetical protein